LLYANHQALYVRVVGRFEGTSGRFIGKPPMLDGEARLVARSGEEDSHYGVGDRIFHQKFGYGRVRMVEGNKLTVEFDKAGEKRVIDSFVVPASAA
jgi:DNA helicase-2/ATP-dependent DNA helicase PcrA